MIGIIGAMTPEVDALQQQMEHPAVTTISGINFWQGTIHNKQVVVAQCGVGKVFAALCAQTMILTYHPDCIINTGVAGGLIPALGVGDVAVATSVVQHDMDTSPLGDPVGLVSGPNLIHFPADSHVAHCMQQAAELQDCGIHTGTIVSGDQFITTPEKKKQLHADFDAIACEMEGAAIGHVCYVNQVPFGVIRVISDSATGDGAMEYSEFLPMAAARSTAIVAEFIKQREG